ncbi:MAG: hypothetical protein REH83_01755 [Rickettsiella sp.]|nr:hypothetical protein [Rickettsiella sp.]
MIIEETKKYFFNAEQASYFENLDGFVFSSLAREREKRQSDFFTNTSYRYGLIQVDEKKLPIHCQVSLVHEALAILECNPEHPELVKALRAYLKLNPKKIKNPIDSELFQDIGRVLGATLSFFVALYTAILAIIALTASLAMPIAPIIGIFVSFILVIGIVHLGLKLGEFIGTKLAQLINRNRIQPNLEDKLKQVIFENVQTISISKQKIEETNQPSLSNDSSISSLYFFPQTKFLGRREEIEKIPTYRNSL